MQPDTTLFMHCVMMYNYRARLLRADCGQWTANIDVLEIRSAPDRSAMDRVVKVETHIERTFFPMYMYNKRCMVQRGLERTDGSSWTSTGIYEVIHMVKSTHDSSTRNLHTENRASVISEHAEIVADS